MSISDDMINYYAKRAWEYEEVYYRDDPGRQQALKDMAAAIRSYFIADHVVELACGTGYWTSHLSQVAKSIVATDINEEVMQVAKTKQFISEVKFQKEDIYNLSFNQGEFKGGMTHFLFSHIPKSKIDRFISDFHKILAPGAKVLISDDVQSPLDNPIYKPHDENTYSERNLSDGSKYIIVKNFFTDDDLISIFSNHVRGFSRKNIYRDGYFWRVMYVV